MKESTSTICNLHSKVSNLPSLAALDRDWETKFIYESIKRILELNENAV